MPLVVDCNYGVLYACRLCGNVKVFQKDCTFDMPLLLSDYHHSETSHYGSQSGPFLLTKWTVLRSKRSVSQRQMVCNRLKPTQYKGRARHGIIRITFTFHSQHSISVPFSIMLKFSAHNLILPIPLNACPIHEAVRKHQPLRFRVMIFISGQAPKRNGTVPPTPVDTYSMELPSVYLPPHSL